MRYITLFLVLFFTASSNATLITYDNVANLTTVASDLVIEDWRSLPSHTILSNQTINGIKYPTDNSLGEPLITLGNFCLYDEYWCISYLTDTGLTRSFGNSWISFEFASPIDAFSLFLIQGINDQLDGMSTWEIEFDTGQVVQFNSEYTLNDSYGLAYIGITGIESALRAIVKQERNDANVVWSFNHIGYQTASVDEPSTVFLLLLASILILVSLKSVKVNLTIKVIKNVL